MCCLPLEGAPHTRGAGLTEQLQVTMETRQPFKVSVPRLRGGGWYQAPTLRLAVSKCGIRFSMVTCSCSASLAPVYYGAPSPLPTGSLLSEAGPQVPPAALLRLALRTDAGLRDARGASPGAGEHIAHLRCSCSSSVRQRQACLCAFSFPHGAVHLQCAMPSTYLFWTSSQSR